MLKFSKVLKPDCEDELTAIPVDAIRANPYQPRKYFSDESLAELANSIKLNGLLQPITVRQTGTGKYELIAGERRLRASKLAGLSEIKAIVVSNAIDQDIAMIALIENLQRENLHFFEEAEGYQSLIREHGFTQEQLAARLSKNQSTIANKLRILRLSRVVKAKLLEVSLTERHARALLRLHNEEAQLALIDRIAAENLSVKATEELVEAELKNLYGEAEPEPRKVVKLRCGYGIYVNTLKKALNKITANGVDADFNCRDMEDYMEVVIRLKK